MNPIQQALASGYTTNQILNFMQSAFPSLNTPITKALRSGYNAVKIVNYLSTLLGGRQEIQGGTEADQEVLNGKRVSENIKNAGKLGLSLAASYGLGKALPAIGQGIAGAFGGGQNAPTPNAPPPMPNTPPITPQGPTQNPIGPHPMANAPVHPPNIPVAPAANPAVAASAPPIQNQPAPQQGSNLGSQQSLQLIKDLGLEQKINSLANAKGNKPNSPENVGSIIASTLNPTQKQILNEKMKSGQFKPLQEAVKDYLSFNQSQPDGQEGQIQKSMESSIEVPEEKRQEEIQMEGPKKGDLVFDESTGISGQLKDIKNKEALIEDEGKLKKSKVENLVPIPEDLQKLDYRGMARRYKETFPEKGPGSLSSNLASLAYNNNTKELIASFISSPNKAYHYYNVPSELYEEIISQSVAPKSSGTSFLSPWDVDVADSRGSPFRKISQNPELYPFYSYDVGYNVMGPLLDAIKEEQKEHEKRKRADKKK